MVSNVLYLPTHRPVDALLEGVLAEAEWVHSRSTSGACFLLVEHGASPETSERNGAALAAAQEAHGSLCSSHLTRERSEELVDAVLQRCDLGPEQRERVRDLLLPVGLSYGAAPNVAYLAAIALGADAVHRRDSDVQVEHGRWPAQFELSMLGKPLGETSAIQSQRGQRHFAPEAQIACVGTCGYGDAAFDRRDLLSAGFDRATAFQSLGSGSADRLGTEMLAGFFMYGEPQIRYQTDAAWIDYEERVEMQACAIGQIFHYLPEMPALNLVGSDYMTKDLAWQMSLPVMFHTRKVKHHYGPYRRDQRSIDDVVDYALRDLRYLQMGRAWSMHNETLGSRWGSLQDFDPATYSKSFLDAADGSKGAMREVRTAAARIYREASSESVDPLRSRLLAVSEAIESEGASLEEGVIGSIRDFTHLVEAWPNMRAGAVRLGSEIEPLLGIQGRS